MGLDGISLNQLRLSPENNSLELNRLASLREGNDIKIVDGLSQGQRVNPDKENENKNESSFSQENDVHDENNAEEQQEEIIKYDLSESEKYVLKLDDASDSIQIIEKATNKVIQSIDPQQLARFVNFLSDSHGSIISRKF